MVKVNGYEINKQRGFADKPDNWIILDKEGYPLQDADGNVFSFFEFSDVVDFLHYDLGISMSQIKKKLGEVF